MLYLDTSLLVAAFVQELKTAVVQPWLEARTDKELAISDWVITEFSAALSIKTRVGQLRSDLRLNALTTFARSCAESFVILSVSRPQFRIAAQLADQSALGVRAGDALHLALSIENGA